MAFPTNPTNGQSATVNNISYVYNSTLGVWESNQVSTSANLTVASDIIMGGQLNGLTVTPAANNTADIPNIGNASAISYTATGNVSGVNVNATGNITALFYTTTRTISSNTTVSATTNAMSAGPITIADGVTVTVADGGEWSIV